MKDKTYAKIMQLYDYIKDFSSQNGFPPTVREIQSRFNIKSTASVSYYMSLLEKENLIKKSPQKNRAVDVISEEKSTEIPIVGDIAAGTPLLAVQNIESHFPVPDGYFGRGSDLFMLKICGNSMIDIGINDGDLVIIRRQETAENGEIAAVLIDNSATLKRFYRENGYFRLKPENSSMEDIITPTANVLGVAVGLVRRFK